MFKPTKIAHLAALLVLLLASAISAARTDDIFVNITANSNTNHGIFIAGADNFILNNITSSGNTRDGINLWFANNSIIANSSIYGNSGFGVYINNTSANNQFYNNLFNNTVNFGINNTTNSANSWNRTEVAGTSIMYGPSLGGNFWATPSNTGYSQNTSCNDSDGDGI
ncbi:hypothetical protein FJZ26_03385, partial [Candidatus Parvarchaeota archaeon]|nr:hypothetical protein [Candidatus Parvarchaeota archaeon]